MEYIVWYFFLTSVAIHLYFLIKFLLQVIQIGLRLRINTDH